MANQTVTSSSLSLIGLFCGIFRIKIIRPRIACLAVRAVCDYDVHGRSEITSLAANWFKRAALCETKDAWNMKSRGQDRADST